MDKCSKPELSCCKVSSATGRIESTAITISVILLSISIVILKPAEAATPGNMQRIGELLVDRTEVSIAEFAEYAETTGVTTSAERLGGGLVYSAGWERMPGWTWRTPFGHDSNPTLPAVHVTFDEASDYCEWAGKRLPTDLEWHLAAYTESRLQPEAPYESGRTYPYPTGSTPLGANCLHDCGETNAIDFSAQLSRGKGPAPVGSSKAGVNGLFDMGANVWEWTETGDGDSQGTRGGSWWYGAAQMNHDHRAFKPRDTAAVYIGFRCVSDG